MKLLVVLFTHNKYAHLISQIWNRINELEFPEGFEVDKLIITEDTEQDIIDYCSQNNLPIQYTTVDFDTMLDYNIDPRYTSSCGFTFEQYFRVCQLRNFYLDIAKSGGYDWMLQVDGDIIPPTDGAIKLLTENKRYIGAGVESKTGLGMYASPNTSGDIVYECDIIGNCFHLEHSDCFNIQYTIEPSVVICADNQYRSKEITKNNIKIYCHSLIKCEHLE